MNSTTFRMIQLSRVFCLIILFSGFSMTSWCQIELDTTMMLRVDKEVTRLEKRLQKELEEGDLIHPIQVDFKREEYRIEEYLRKMVERDYSDKAYLRELLNAERRYDQLLTRYYEMLYDTLNEKDRDLLEDSHIHWLAFRNMEQELNKRVNPMAYNMSAIPMEGMAERYLDITKFRVAEYVDYLARLGRNKK